MTRGRISAAVEAAREIDEGALAMLGNARVYLRLVKERVSMAATNGHESLLSPALDDLRHAERLIQAAQVNLIRARANNQ